MPGVLIILFVLIVAIPVGVLVSGAVASAILGYGVKREADHNHEGSELLDTNW
jgi:hypothetical protein